MKQSITRNHRETVQKTISRPRRASHSLKWTWDFVDSFKTHSWGNRFFIPGNGRPFRNILINFQWSAFLVSVHHAVSGEWNENLLCHIFKRNLHFERFIKTLMFLRKFLWLYRVSSPEAMMCRNRCRETSEMIYFLFNQGSVNLMPPIPSSISGNTNLYITFSRLVLGPDVLCSSNFLRTYILYGDYWWLHGCIKRNAQKYQCFFSKFPRIHISFLQNLHRTSCLRTRLHLFITRLTIESINAA